MVNQYGQKQNKKFKKLCPHIPPGIINWDFIFGVRVEERFGFVFDNLKNLMDMSCFTVSDFLGFWQFAWCLVDYLGHTMFKSNLDRQKDQREN